MPTVKIRDVSGGTTHSGLWRIIGKHGLKANKVKDAHQAFYVIVEQEDLERFTSTTTKDLFKDDGLEILNPPELEALRTIVARNLDRHIDDYTEEEI